MIQHVYIHSYIYRYHNIADLPLPTAVGIVTFPTGWEVDFVWHAERGLLAFEVKRPFRDTADACKGRKAFPSDYPMAQIALACGGQPELEIR